jgi:hypothetical protein
MGYYQRDRQKEGRRKEGRKEGKEEEKGKEGESARERFFPCPRELTPDL